MTNIVEAPIGSDGGKAALSVEGGMVTLKVQYPAAKILEPIVKVLNDGVDKLEALIPGDQKTAAAGIKAALQAEIDRILNEAK